jgi:DNA polymerase III sliding clamp (beta) subunit (PCNA family)
MNSSTTSLTSPGQWSVLRRTARQLEVECENKLSIYARLASSVPNVKSSYSNGHTSMEASEKEIEDALRRVSIILGIPHVLFH